MDNIEKKTDKILVKVEKLASASRGADPRREKESCVTEYESFFETLPLNSESELKAFEEALLADPKLRKAFFK